MSYKTIRYNERSENFRKMHAGEILEDFVKKGYLLHGSPVKKIKGGVLKPGKSGLCATNWYKVAVFKALVSHIGDMRYNLHSKNAPFNVEFHIPSKEEIKRGEYSSSDRAEIRIHSSGYVYVLSADGFEKGAYPLEFRAYKSKKPLLAIEVTIYDLKEFLGEIKITNPDGVKYRIITPVGTFEGRKNFDIVKI